jgi:hypothetical protein
MARQPRTSSGVPIISRQCQPQRTGVDFGVRDGVLTMADPSIHRFPAKLS